MIGAATVSPDSQDVADRIGRVVARQRAAEVILLVHQALIRLRHAVAQGGRRQDVRMVEAVQDLRALAGREGRAVGGSGPAGPCAAGCRQDVFGIEAEGDDEIGRVDAAAHAIADGGSPWPRSIR